MSFKNLFRKFRPAPREKDDEPAESTERERWVVVGLGNPGEEYSRSRHNLGFRAVERLARGEGAEFDRRKFKGVIAEAEVGGAPTLLVKPQTYYNASGECVAGVLGYFKVPASRLIVVHDELDLPAGRLRLKQGGSDAGNRGVRSIAESLGSEDFIRVRVGIGRPPVGDDAKDYLLRGQTAQERAAMDESVARAADAVDAIVREGLERAMGRFNQRG
jgi:PTH1 family peptidyl-tRNA hydrolase